MKTKQKLRQPDWNPSKVIQTLAQVQVEAEEEEFSSAFCFSFSNFKM